MVLLNDKLDIKAIAKQFEDEITKKTADYIEIQVKAEAQKASARAKIIRSRSGKRYRYSNTGQLARNIKKARENGMYTISDGTRSNYSDGTYHGMYFLVEKRGENAIKQILKNAKAYTESTKL